jgi:perosamine synthetase
MKVPLSQPDINEQDIAAVLDVLKTNQLSIGPKVIEFEKIMAHWAGQKHGIAVNSGTSGLHLIVRAMGLKDDDEVITTPFSFVASSNCLLFERVKPVFVDIDPDTLNIDANYIERAITPKTKAILAVHAFGHVADMDPIQEMARRHGLKVIEDSCEAIGAEYKGRPAGSLGDAGVFAFYPNKQMTTGEGGVIVTNNDEIAELCRSMRNQGRGEGDRWLFHERLGYNYRLDELSCALGVSQAARLGEILAMRSDVAERYNRRLAGIDGVRLPFAADYAKVSWFIYVIRLANGIDRDKVMQTLADNGIGCRPYFTPIHLQPFYRDMFGYKEGDFPITERVAASTVALPFYNKITDAQIDYVADILERSIKKQR